MSLQVADRVWGRKRASSVRDTLSRIATMIARFEPVSALVAPGTNLPAVAGVDYIEYHTDDLWLRDTGPAFVIGGHQLAGVDLNFNGRGGRQDHQQDAGVAAAICAAACAERLTTELVLEGGAIEVDGAGTALVTESSVLNSNRNPGWTRAAVEHELATLFGVTTCIWLPGIAGRDHTDGHIDQYARFTRPGVVVAARNDDTDNCDYAVTRTHLDVLTGAVDAAGRSVEVHALPGPRSVRSSHATADFVASYTNFYLCNNAVILPEFGDTTADSCAQNALAALFPDREMVPMNIDALAANGGIHRATRQEPRPNSAAPG